MIRLGCIVLGGGYCSHYDSYAMESLDVNWFNCYWVGCSPICQVLFISTPAAIFGEQLSQAMIGVEMASACYRISCVPPLFGIIAP